MKNSDKQILDSFAIGDYIRLFKTNDGQVYKCYNLNKETNTVSKLINVDLSAHYFLKDKTSMLIDNSYSSGFLSEAKSSILNDKSEIYYNVDNININTSISFLQYNNRCYFLNKNSYETDNAYSLDTYKTLPSAYSFLSTYVSTKYNEDYFSNAQCVDNKSIPIYDINADALKRISYLKFNNSNYIYSFIKKYNLENVENLLFNGDELKFDDENYDSIYIDTLLNVISENELDSEKIFDDLFSNLGKDSFLRMFNQIGQIRSIRNEKYSINENEYMYSFDLSTLDTDDIQVNYFTLKNLKSPELYQNYKLTSINENSSIKANSYDFNYNIVANIFNDYYYNFANKIKEYEFENDCIINLSKNVKDEDFMSELTDILHEKYSGILKSSFDTRFSLLSSNYLDDLFFNIAYNEYYSRNYNANIRFDSVIISKLDFIKKIFDLYDDFIVSFDECPIKNNIKISSLKSLFENLIKYIIKLASSENISLTSDDDLSTYEFTFNTAYDKIKNDTYDLYDVYVTLNEENIEKSIILEINKSIFECSYDDTTIFEKAVENNIFKSDVYRVIIKPILNEIGAIDASIFENATSEELSEYSSRMNAKVSDYISSYDNMFDHENEMKVSGYLYGYRKYNKAFKNTTNDLYLTYNYDNVFDLNFANEVLPDSKTIRFNEVEDMISENVIPSSILSSDNIYILSKDVAYYALTSIFNSEFYDKTLEQNKLNAEFIENAFSLKNDIYLYEVVSLDGFDWISSPYGKIKIFKIMDDEYVISLDTSKVGRYFTTINKVKNIEFSERIKGEHYYKELEKSKSNVFSLNIKNSGLSYNLYSYDEVVQNLIENESIEMNDDKFIVNNEEKSFAWILDHSSYHKIIENEHTYYNEIKKNEDSDDYKSFKYFKVEDDSRVDEIRKIIKTKLQIRKTFDASIRKSIHRYMPVNTTLWKINYLKDDVIDLK